MRRFLIDGALNLLPNEVCKKMAVPYVLADLKTFDRVLKVALLLIFNNELLLGRKRNDSELLHSAIIIINIYYNPNI